MHLKKNSTKTDRKRLCVYTSTKEQTSLQQPVVTANQVLITAHTHTRTIVTK